MHPDDFSPGGKQAMQNPGYALGYIVTMLEQRAREHDQCKAERIGTEKELFTRQGRLELRAAHANGVEEGEHRAVVDKVRLTESGSFKPVNRFFAALSWQSALKGTVIVAILVAGVITGIIVGYARSKGG